MNRLETTPLWGPLSVAVWSATGNLLEQGDQSVFTWTGGWVSGHSLKHAVAALAAWPVLAAMASRTAGHTAVAD